MGFRSISVNTTPNTSLVVTPPAGIVDGDILIAFAFSDSTAAGPVLPAGFTAFTGLPETSDFDGLTFLAGYKKAASESGNYTMTDTHTLIGGVLAMQGEHATTFLHKTSVGAAGTPGDATQWDLTTAAFGGGNTTVTCDIVMIGASDNNPGGTVDHTEPAGFTMRSDFSNAGFFNGFVATKDGAAAGETGAYTAHGDLTGATAGFAAVAVALQNAAAVQVPPMFRGV